ncbi:hypothetical protein [Neorhizobium galegae]|uniref:hypothetical protein n=1 Tax=Neorhizobium galegae TaxID=399 RepID=UPI002105778D|nr:hypothetical protein [Neorhizobium galegae]MCQ1854971.1 hypothetical protein [Neorhizobium galegae]
MKRDYISEIDRIGTQLADLRTALAGQAGDAAESAATYIVPTARQFAWQFQKESYGLGKAAQRNPSAATGAIVGVMLFGAAVAWLLTASGRERDE